MTSCKILGNPNRHQNQQQNQILNQISGRKQIPGEHLRILHTILIGFVKLVSVSYLMDQFIFHYLISPAKAHFPNYTCAPTAAPNHMVR